MKKYRFFIEKGSITPRNFLIKDEGTVKHISLVKRLKKGQEIILFDGMGMEYLGKIGYMDKTQVAGLITGSWEAEMSDKPKLILAQALPRAGKMDEIIRMNTEAGVTGFILFESEYSIAKKEDYTDAKLDRLIKVSKEALRQSEGVLLPEFKGPVSFNDLLKAEAQHKLLLHSREVEGSIDIKEIKYTNKDIIVLVIGPEGGFSPSEIEKVKDSEFKLVHLDMPILRTETAGIAASSILLS